MFLPKSTLSPVVTSYLMSQTPGRKIVLPLPFPCDAAPSISNLLPFSLYSLHPQLSLEGPQPFLFWMVATQPGL
jgi:hypothetical protein